MSTLIPTEPTSCSFFVVARNAAGTSLPSSIITLNVSKEAWSGDHANGVRSNSILPIDLPICIRWPPNTWIATRPAGWPSQFFPQGLETDRSPSTRFNCNDLVKTFDSKVKKKNKSKQQNWKNAFQVEHGVSSPPHLLAVESHSATWLQVLIKVVFI